MVRVSVQNRSVRALRHSLDGNRRLMAETRIFLKSLKWKKVELVEE